MQTRGHMEDDSGVSVTSSSLSSSRDSSELSSSSSSSEPSVRSKPEAFDPGPRLKTPRSLLHLHAVDSHRRTPSPPTLIWICDDGLSLLKLSWCAGRMRRWGHGWANLPLILASSQHLTNQQ